MTLLQLDVEQFRCIEKARLELSPAVNVITGQNASGKTSLLEAIFLLGTGHSFRCHETQTLVRAGADAFLAVARIGSSRGNEVLGIRGSGDRKDVRVNAEPARGLADLALRLPVQVIDPEVHRLLEDGPLRRRRFLDWGVFHVEHQFHDAWRRYQRALRQRNAALKAKSPIHVLSVWNQELVEQGTLVANLRDQYVSELRPVVAEFGRRLLGLELDIEHQRGWKRNIELAEALGSTLHRDQLRGSTGVGPHRSDLGLKVDGVAAKDRVSRGQQKMIACSLLLAQQVHRASSGAVPACLLLDDPAAELDSESLVRLLDAVASIPAQLILTSLTEDVVKFFAAPRLFHVEHGAVRAMA